MTTTSYLQFAAALIFVLALIGVAAFAARRLGLGHAALPTGRRRRLAIVEVLPLDGRRRLVLLRRDAVEHLVILGPSSETVVESVIAPPIAFAAAVREQTAVSAEEAVR
jgi:flagellar protein FliO/FliZ